MSASDVLVDVRELRKTFTLYAQHGVTLPVLRGVSLTVRAGECVALGDPSGAGKSTLLRTIYGNYLAQAGAILVRHVGTVVDMARAEPRQVLAVRRFTIGYVSQFLRVLPRVPTVEVVSEPLRRRGLAGEEAGKVARRVLDRLRIPERLWSVSPVTFSGGEQQRVNVARGLAPDYPILLLDEPTASLDTDSRAVVVDLICEARNRGAALLGTFHDREVRDAVSTRTVYLHGTTA
jgi:alpha-D-ribose 1-methylphosphonate 5-triphosphate synthase subunit PhnL